MKTKEQKAKHAAYMRHYYQTNDEAYLKFSLRRILQRCESESDKEYHMYGGRGIFVCEQWRTDPSAFVEWAMRSGWRRDLQIDRTNNDGPYAPENCQWVSRKENSRNRRNSKLSVSTVAEIRSLLAQGRNGPSLAKQFGVHHSLIYRIKLNKQWVG